MFRSAVVKEKLYPLNSLHNHACVFLLSIKSFLCFPLAAPNLFVGKLFCSVFNAFFANTTISDTANHFRKQQKTFCSRYFFISIYDFLILFTLHTKSFGSEYTLRSAWFLCLLYLQLLHFQIIGESREPA